MHSEHSVLSDAELLTSTKELVRRSNELDADLVSLLAEVEGRGLHLKLGYSSMHVFCTGELGLSDDAAYNRRMVAKLVPRCPAVLEYLRSGRIHLTGLRLLEPVLTAENAEDVLSRAEHRSKREIEELVASLQPKPPVPTSIRKLPSAPTTQAVDPRTLTLWEATATASASSTEGATSPTTSAVAPPQLATPSLTPTQLGLASTPSASGPSPRTAAVVEPLSADTFLVKFTASRGLRDKLQQAQALLRHRLPDGDLSRILEFAVDLLIERTKKERFGIGRKSRTAQTEGTKAPASTPAAAPSRHIPEEIKRTVYERDGGQCRFVSPVTGRRCGETAWLQLHHTEGFARTGEHSVAAIELRCAAHDQYEADVMYGRAFMEEARSRTRSGTGDSISRPCDEERQLS